TTYGIIGIKVWVYKGDMLPGGELPPEPARDDDRRSRRPRGDRPEGRRPARGRGGPRRTEAPAPAAAAPARESSCCHPNAENIAKSSRAAIPAWLPAAPMCRLANSASRRPVAVA